MADTKISGATDGVTFNATDKIPLARSGSTSKLWATGTYIATFLASLTQTLTNKTITQGINPQTGTTYTFVATDFTGKVTANNSAAQTYTAPQQSTLTTAAGVGVWLENIGTGTITIVKEGSETLLGNTTVAPGANVYISRNTTTVWSVGFGTAIVPEQMTIFIAGTIVNQTYDICVALPFPLTVTDLALKTTTTTVAGTYTAALSGVSITGLTAIVPSASGVRTLTSASAANVAVNGDYLTIAFSGATIVDASVTVQYTRIY